MLNPTVKLVFAAPQTRTLEPPSAKYTKPKPKPQRKATDRPKASAIPESTIDKLKRLKDPESKEMFDAVFAGTSFADAGERDTLLQRVCSSMAWADEGKTDPAVLAELLRPSLAVWAAEDIGHDLEDDLDRAVEKLTRAASEFEVKHRARLELIEGLRKVLTKGAELSFQHLALQQDNSFYIYSFNDEKYWPSCTTRELPLVVRDAWPEGSPVELTFIDEKGKTKKKTNAQFLAEYGTVIRKVILSMAASKTVYDPVSRVLRVPSATRRVLKPKHHKEIAEWLSLLPARGRHQEMLLDWIATVTNLNRMSAALYLSGPKGTGKSLLVAGLSRLWETGPTKLEHALQRFNFSISECPLVNVDESWADQKVNLCAQLRELVGNMTHRIEPKGKPIVELEGAVRLVITANNETLLNVKGNGDQNPQEREATIERVLHVPTSSEAEAYLLTVRDRHLWREKSWIAEHALWLKQDRAEQVITSALDDGNRFLIQGDAEDAEFYDNIGARPKDHDAAVQWLACLLTRAIPPNIRKMVKAEPDRFIVVPRAMCETWMGYGLDKLFDTPTSSNQASRILRPFLGNRTKLEGMNGYRIDIERFARAALNEGLVTPEQLEEKLGASV